MIIELTGADFTNKGGELMLGTVARRLADHFPNCQPAIARRIGSAQERRALGLKDILWIRHHRVATLRVAYNAALALNALRPRRANGAADEVEMPYGEGSPVQKIQRRIHKLNLARQQCIVLGKDVNVVLDLSGYAYGDPWGPGRAERNAQYYRRVRRRGGKVILMPQQLGPFDKPNVRDAFRRLSTHCDLIFAREGASYELANEVIESGTVLRKAPDFTILQKGAAPTDGNLQGKAWIIPNFKMLRETQADVREAYPKFLRSCVLALRERGIEPLVLLHEHSGRDLDIAQKLSGEVGGIETVSEADPLRLKGIIGASFLTIGSRFHGLVSALSQGVPSLGTGWSHKYRTLFADYGFPDGVVDPRLSDDELASKLDELTNKDRRDALISTLRERNTIQRERVKAMWDEIHSLVA